MQDKASLKGLMAMMHEAVVQMSALYFERYHRRIHATPKSFLSFLETFCRLYHRKLNHITILSQAISAGLQKMSDAKVDVNRMKVPSEVHKCVLVLLLRILFAMHFRFYQQADLAIQTMELQSAAADAELLLASITVSTAQTETEKARVAVIVTAVTEKAQVIRMQASLDVVSAILILVLCESRDVQ